MRALALAFSLIASTAAGHAAPPAKELPAAYQFVAFGVLPELWVDGPKGKPTRVLASSHRFSPDHIAPTDGQVSLFKLVPAPEPDAPPVRVPVAQVRVQTSANARSLIVMSTPPTGATSTPPRLLVLPCDTASHPPGTVRAVNLASRTGAIQLGADAKQLDPGAHTLLPFPNGERPWLQVAALGPNGWQRVIGIPIRLKEGDRMTLFFLDPPPLEGDPYPFGLVSRNITDRPPQPDA